jgi:hypothetical protein
VASFGVEPVVSVVYLAKQNGHSLFKEGQLWGKLGLGHLKLLWTGRSRMALFLSYKPRNTHLALLHVSITRTLMFVLWGCKLSIQGAPNTWNGQGGTELDRSMMDVTTHSVWR